MWDKLRVVVCTVLFLGGALVSILGHRIEGTKGVILMLVGPVMYLLFLYLYNRKYR